MNKERIQHTAISTIVFAVVFALLLFFFYPGAIRTVSGKVAGIIVGSLIFFAISYFLRRK